MCFGRETSIKILKAKSKCYELENDKLMKSTTIYVCCIPKIERKNVSHGE